jgi:hypothetical protein
VAAVASISMSASGRSRLFTGTVFTVNGLPSNSCARTAAASA